MSGKAFLWRFLREILTTPAVWCLFAVGVVLNGFAEELHVFHLSEIAKGVPSPFVLQFWIRLWNAFSVHWAGSGTIAVIVLVVVLGAAGALVLPLFNDSVTSRRRLLGGLLGVAAFWVILNQRTAFRTGGSNSGGSLIDVAIIHFAFAAVLGGWLAFGLSLALDAETINRDQVQCVLGFAAALTTIMTGLGILYREAFREKPDVTGGFLHPMLRPVVTNGTLSDHIGQLIANGVKIWVGLCLLYLLEASGLWANLYQVMGSLGKHPQFLAVCGVFLTVMIVSVRLPLLLSFGLAVSLPARMLINFGYDPSLATAMVLLACCTWYALPEWFSAWTRAVANPATGSDHVSYRMKARRFLRSVVSFLGNMIIFRFARNKHGLQLFFKMIKHSWICMIQGFGFVWPLSVLAVSLFFVDPDIWKSLDSDPLTRGSLMFAANWMFGGLMISAAAHIYTATPDQDGPAWVAVRVLLVLAGASFLLDEAGLFGLTPVFLQWTGGLLLAGCLALVLLLSTETPATSPSLSTRPPTAA